MLKGRCAYFLLTGLLFTAMFIVLGAGSARGQRIYATTETHSPKQSALITLSEVRDPTFAVDGNNGTYSTLYTSLGLLS